MRTYTNLLHVQVASRLGIVSSTVSVFRSKDEQVSLSWFPEQSFKDTLIPPSPNPGQVPNQTQLSSTQLNSSQPPFCFFPLLEETRPLVKNVSLPSREAKTNIGICYTMLYTLSLDPREWIWRWWRQVPQNKSAQNYYHHVSLFPASGGPFFDGMQWKWYQIFFNTE